jgi:hypothetical protein
MSDQQKEEDKTKDYYEYRATDNQSDSSAKTNNIKDKIVDKIKPQIDKFAAEEKGNTNLSESARMSNNVRAIILGLFVLIGFIILVFAVFTASVGSQIAQAQFANGVFIAAIVGAFTLVGVLVYQIRG